MKYYVTVDTKSKLLELVSKVKEASAIAIDTETTSLNVRTGKIIGVSFTTKVGEGYYIPTLVYNSKTDTLDSLSIDGLSSEEIAKQVLNLCHGKKLIAHNASYDLRIIKNYFGIDLLPSLWIETLLLVHTVMEEGAFGYGGAPFALKTLAKAVQEEIGLDVEKEANQEQVELKASIVKNRGSVSKANYELYKADLEVLSKYACADTDLTFRIAKLFLKRLADEGLDDFFFKDEVMPLYKEVTIPMEERGVRVDLELLNKTKADIEADLASNKKKVIDSLLAIPEARLWILEQAHIKFPPSRRGSYAQKFAEVYKEHLPLPVKKDGKIDTSKKAILNLPDSPYKDFLLNPKEHELDKSELLKISSLLWKDYNEGEYINIQSKKHLGEIVFDKMNIGSLSKTKKGKKQFDDEFVEHLSKTYEWANNLRIYNRLLKIKSTYVDRFLERHENGRYYFYYKQHGTVSGRYGSDAQQLPKPKEEGDDVPIVVHYTNLVRKFLISDEDRIFVDCDYESLEPHCVDPESLIVTRSKLSSSTYGPALSDGMKRLKDVNVGDYILGKDGYHREVLNKWKTRKKIRKIVTNRGVIKCSLDHKFYVNGKWTPAKEIKIGDVFQDMSKHVIKSYESINSISYNNNYNKALPVYSSKTTLPLKEPLGFRTVKEVDGYITGVLLGDGMIQDGMVGIVGLREDKVIDEFYNYFYQLGYKITTIDESDTVRQFRVVSRDVHSFVKNTLGIVKTTNGKKLLRVPDWILHPTTSLKIRLAFLAGLIDSDGTVSKKGNEANISTKCGRFATDIINLGKTFGCDFRLLRSSRMNKNQTRELEWYTVRIVLRDMVTLENKGINNFITVSRKKFTRKSTKARHIVPATIVRFIEDCDSKMDMIDITVDETEEFVLDGFRSHNCFASVSNDPGLQDIFAKGHDFYSTVAIKTENLQGVSADKSAPNFLKKVDANKRNSAKAYSLGIAYGMGEYALGMTLGIPTKEAAKLIEGYLSGFPELRKWREDSRDQMKNLGFVKSAVGRVRHLTRGKDVYDAFGEKILNWQFRRKIASTGQLTKDEVQHCYRDLKNALNNCLNFQIQSLAASVVNRAAIAINRELKRRNIDGLVVAQIHDQLVVSCNREDADEVKDLVQDLMENTTKLKGVTLKAPPEIALNFADGH